VFVSAFLGLRTEILGQWPKSQGSTLRYRHSPHMQNEETSSGEERINEICYVVAQACLGKKQSKHFSHLQGPDMNFRYK
jgi:hypothetical protein